MANVTHYCGHYQRVYTEITQQPNFATWLEVGQILKCTQKVGAFPCKKSVLFLVLLFVGFIIVMFYTDSLISLTYCVFVTVYRSVLIYSAAQLQECLINLLTYLELHSNIDCSFWCVRHALGTL